MDPLENNYFAVVRPSLESLATEVSGYRRHGWRLHGFMFIDKKGDYVQLVERDPRRSTTSMMEALPQEARPQEACQQIARFLGVEESKIQAS